MKKKKDLPAGWRKVAANFAHLGMIQVSNALVQLLLFPFIIRKTGIEAFGPVVVANSFAALMGLVVNFGTSISGVREVAAAGNQREKLAVLFSHTFALRSFFLTVPLLALPVVWLLAPLYFGYFLLAMPLVLAELVNPLYFFNGKERLLPYNLGNLVSKLLAVLLILFFVEGPSGAKWVNFWLGLPALVIFLVLNGYLFRLEKLHWVGASWQAVKTMVRQNMPLTGNNLSVQLQQSFFLFVLSTTGNALLLGAYALADKLLWGFRLVLIAFSNALFPKAVLMAAQDPALAKIRKQQINSFLAMVFSGVAILLYTWPEHVVRLFAGLEQATATATVLVRAIAFVPLLMALNTLNVIEMLVQHRYQAIFKIAGLLTLVTMLASLVIIKIGTLQVIAWYPFVMELSALLLFLFFLSPKKSSVPVAG